MKIAAIAGMMMLLSPLMLNPAMAAKQQNSIEYIQPNKNESEPPKKIQLKVSKVRDANTTFLALAIDSKTGAYYTRMGYGFEGPEVQIYKNGAAFQAGDVSEILKLDGAMMAGTYMTATDGQLYGRIFDAQGDWGWPDANILGRWDATTGQLNAKAEMPGMGGRNGNDTFNWGGFSALNTMQDQTGRYVMGTEGSGTWVVLKLSDDLKVLDARKFEAGSLGWAYMREGQIYISDSYDSNHIGQVFDFENGTMRQANYDLIGFANNGETGLPNVYLSMTSYDLVNDIVYFQNSNDQTIYRLGKGYFDGEGGGAGAVPEPAMWAMLIAGFGFIGAAMRHRRSAATIA